MSIRVLRITLRLHVIQNLSCGRHSFCLDNSRYGYMQARRHLELLEVKELNQLMELAVEAACFARGFGQRLVAAYHGLAAECAFELWWRNQEGEAVRVPVPYPAFPTDVYRRYPG